ncbi:hypothetical protein BU23DRAFT_128017 [Bimuria novae-zelandiae CBS 107.79]|uniref:DUF3176 domain-containing protein n=1 Tax=Bimuria novae-zelandiae CBS 107.79 TaxID=1447943 RepID=A0A6A5VJV7_9PLEO|nr:hypothetical protein BU23DRAFT_128017 [Bimuria novae-zelandiae CBS 107.79]
MATYSSRTLLDSYAGVAKAYNNRRARYKLPLLIISLLTILVACITAAVVILLTSHEDPVQAWKIRPSVWLSILAGVYAIALAGLFSTGVTVVWWRCIAHGTTLERLHFIHAGVIPQDLVPAFVAGSHARRVAVVALLVFATKLAVGPLLQRATRPKTHEATRDVRLSISLATDIPEGWFGAQETFGGAGILASQATFFGWNLTNGNTTNSSCPPNGTCDTSVEAVGLNFTNSTDFTTLNLLDRANVNQTLFSINLTMSDQSGLPVLYLDSHFVSSIDDNCIATVTRETYALVPAIMRYPISMQDNRISPDIDSVMDNPKIVANYSSPGINGMTDVLGGILEALRPIYSSRAILDLPPEGKPALYENLNNFWADIFNTGIVLRSEIPENVSKYCSQLWVSPTKYVLAQILGYTFRTSSMVAAKRGGDGDKQNVTAVYTGEELWYVTDFGWLAGAIAIMVVGSAAALSLSWGWWQLDRYVTLSPLETGKAFGASILAQAGSEAEANSILREVGQELVAHDGDELIWAGSLYATGARDSVRSETSPRPSRRSEDPGLYDISPFDTPENEQSNVRRHRRGVRSMNEADPIRVTRAFEHDRGYTTRKPYGDEEEMDIGQYGRPWGSDQANDHVPLIQMLSNIAAPGNGPFDIRAAQPPPVPLPTGGQMRSLGERRKPRRASVRGLLPRIEERDTPTPDGSGR